LPAVTTLIDNIYVNITQSVAANHTQIAVSSAQYCECPSSGTGSLSIFSQFIPNVDKSMLSTSRLITTDGVFFAVDDSLVVKFTSLSSSIVLSASLSAYVEACSTMYLGIRVSIVRSGLS
jgi:hypothetical protein